MALDYIKVEYLIYWIPLFVVTNKFYAILWDSSYRATTLNSQNNNITNWNISYNAALNNYNISTTITANANIDGYYTFFIELASPYSFGAYTFYSLYIK